MLCKHKTARNVFAIRGYYGSSYKTEEDKFLLRT